MTAERVEQRTPSPRLFETGELPPIVRDPSQPVARKPFQGFFFKLRLVAIYIVKYLGLKDEERTVDPTFRGLWFLRESDDPGAVLEKKDKSTMIRKCLTGLSAEHREIIDLVYYHEKSVEEVAEIVGIPENTVKTRMFYARKRLAELVKAAGIDRGWP